MRRKWGRVKFSGIRRKFGYRTVDTSSMSIQALIKTFADARHIIAILGNGSSTT